MKNIQRTTLILGAGTSIPYGYPSGEDLKYEIISLAKDIIDSNDHRFDNYFSTDQLSAFISKLKLNHGNSIDSFLESFPDYGDLGRTLLAQILIYYEIPDNLLDRTIRKKGIYQALFNSIYRIHSSLSPDDFSIITFNYDLSLEQDFYNALQGQNLTSTQMEDFWERLPIFHINGKLGSLDWQVNGGRVYGKTNDIFSDPRQIDYIKKDMLPEFTTDNKIIKLNTAESKRMRSNLMNSERIIFLGFGYHQQNMDKLGFKEYITETTNRLLQLNNRINIPSMLHNKIFGTCYQMSSKDIGNLKDQYYINLADNTQDDISFFKTLSLE